jgi:hypothetical protein
MGTINNILPALEADVINLVIPSLTNIQTALTTISQNPGNAVVLAEQEAVIIANVNTVIADAPAALPALQATAIGLGAQEGAALVGKLIAYLNGLNTSSGK